jgi:GNAT superfamily N-acetyltransferase
MLWDLEVGGRQFRVRELEPADEESVLALFAAAEDWFTAATGQPAAPGDVQSLLYALPEGAAFEDKVLLVVETDRRTVGVVDAVLRHPTAASCSVGMFLVHPAHRRQGLGRHAAAVLLGELAARGRTEVVAPVTEGRQPGRAFLAALGFALDAPGTAASANRDPGPAERPALPARLRLPAAAGRTAAVPRHGGPDHRP